MLRSVAVDTVVFPPFPNPQAYINRYGPGMAIYWFGFIEELDTLQGLLLVDDFPALRDIMCLSSAYSTQGISNGQR